MGKRKTYYEHGMIDYTSANVLFENGIYSSCATHCQQASEKFMKHVVEVLDLSEVDVLKTHSLLVLLKTILAYFPGVKITKKDCGYLSGMYFDMRYPSFQNDELDKEDAEICLSIMNGIKQEVDSILSDTFQTKEESV